MSNVVISYKGTNSYLNTDDSINPRIYTNINDYNKVYLNANMDNTFEGLNLLSDNLQNMYNNFNWDYVKSMNYTYYNCQNLKGSPICGPNVVDMGYTYYNCFNLTGNVTIPTSVNNLINTFYLPSGVMAVNVSLPSKWQGNPQISTWSSCVNNITYY